ncbi:MAG: tetratricopeptide repeat protein, partial [Pseudomonadota bacterium]
LLIVIEFLRRLKTTRTAQVSTLAAVLLMAAVLTYQRNRVWSNSVALWTDTVAKSPTKARPRFQLAYAYFEAGRCGDAVSQYAQAATLEKPDYNLLIDWALAADCAGGREQAIAELRAAAAIERTAHVYSLIGMIFGEQGKAADSLDALAEASSIDPRYEMTYVYRGNVYASAGQFDKAAAEYSHALALNPSDQVARNGLASAGRHLTR